MENHQLTFNAQPDKIRNDILCTLAYFDAFNYPLTYAEMQLFLGNKCDSELFNTALSALAGNFSIYRFDGYYCLKNDPTIATYRRDGNEKAAKLIKTAKKVCNLLIKFPYVRGIAISGSLSKNYAHDKSDIDLFVITTANRLWIARTLLHLFKKLTFLINKEHLFCMNYFVDEAGLQIVEKNIYTATEVVTLIPVEGDVAFKKFYSANNWTLDFLPNNYMRIATANPLRLTVVKKLIEIALGGAIGNVFERNLQKLTAALWLKKTQQKRLNDNGVIMSMAADKHFAKPDPVNFQQKVIARYKQRVKELYTKNGIMANV